MTKVNARDAQAFAEWTHKQLPTEAQWELAARSTDGRLYPWGSQPLPAGKLRLASQPGAVMAASDDRSPYGVFDLGGNVLEWTRDWYDARLYRARGPDVVDNPTGPAARPRSLELVVKGDRKTGSAATRQPMNMDKRLTFVGFRCVLPVGEATAAVNPAPAAPAGAAPAPAPAPASQPPAQPPRPPQQDAVPF